MYFIFWVLFGNQGCGLSTKPILRTTTEYLIGSFLRWTRENELRDV